MGVQCLSRGLYSSLRQSLESKLPLAMSVYSVINLIDEGPLDGFRVWTDSWPCYSAVIVSADTSKVKNPFLRRQVFTYCESKQGLHQILRHKRTIEGTHASLFAASKDSVEVFDEVFNAISGPCQPSAVNTILYELQPNLCDTWSCPLPDDVREGVLTEEAVMSVDAGWLLTEPGTADLIHSMLSSSKMLNVCVYDKQNKPVAWTIEQIHGVVGMTFVMSEFRRRGFGKYVTMRLAEKLQQRGGRAYVLLIESNHATVKMHEELGFRKSQYPCLKFIFKCYETKYN